MLVDEDKDCRLCNSKELEEYLDLGLTPPADRFTALSNKDELEYYFPLKVNICKNCGWHQLSHVVDPKILYQEDYPYDSTVTETGRLHWRNFSTEIAERYNLESDSLVLDIGSNTGALLQSFVEIGIKVIGIDPSKTATMIAERKGIHTITDFFNKESSDTLIKEYGKPNVITATNSFAHVDDLQSWIENVDRVLEINGVIIIEAPHLLSLINNLEFDTIYHEHLSYVSVSPLINFFSRYGFEINKVEKQLIHGGSLRMHVSRTGTFQVEQNTIEIIEEEKRSGIYDLKNLSIFADSVVSIKLKLQKILQNIYDSNQTVAIASAPAKGMTLLHYVGIKEKEILAVSDKSHLKIGKFLPGLDLKVVTDKEMLKLKPDFILILAWNFAPEIIKNLKSEYNNKFIIPIPNPMII
jgi:SAM-dependent methyltransferase